jgi:acetyl-CoA acetyltransferase
VFRTEIVPVPLPAAASASAAAASKDSKSAASKSVTQDDEPFRVSDWDKVRAVKPSFDSKKGTITAANASTISDGAAALVLTSRAYAVAHGLPILASIRGYSDAALEPAQYPVAPALAIPAALKHAGVKQDDGACPPVHRLNHSLTSLSFFTHSYVHCVLW